MLCLSALLICFRLRFKVADTLRHRGRLGVIVNDDYEKYGLSPSFVIIQCTSMFASAFVN